METSVCTYPWTAYCRGHLTAHTASAFLERSGDHGRGIGPCGKGLADPDQTLQSAWAHAGIEPTVLL